MSSLTPWAFQFSFQWRHRSNGCLPPRGQHAIPSRSWGRSQPCRSSVCHAAEQSWPRRVTGENIWTSFYISANQINMVACNNNVMLVCISPEYGDNFDEHKVNHKKVIMVTVVRRSGVFVYALPVQVLLVAETLRRISSTHADFNNKGKSKQLCVRFHGCM